jgi:hypothetical protein
MALRAIDFASGFGGSIVSQSAQNFKVPREVPRSRKLALLAITPPDIRVLSFARGRCCTINNMALTLLRRVVLSLNCVNLNPRTE